MIALRAGLGAVNEITVFLAAKEEGRYPVLRGLAQGVESFPEITGHIDTILDRYGKIKDSASPELYTIRRTIRDREGQVSKRLQAILSKAQKDGYADADAAVSIRDGRAVIPVSAANKRKINGFIHDTCEGPLGCGERMREAGSFRRGNAVAALGTPSAAAADAGARGETGGTPRPEARPRTPHARHFGS